MRIILSVINDLSGDQRLDRIAASLQEAGAKVLVVGRQLPDSLPLEVRPYQTHRMRLWTKRGKLFYLEYTIRLFFLLLKTKADILTANDLDTLLANYVASRLKGCRLVYDSHEYFTEVPELIDRPVSRKIWLTLERWLFPKLKTIYTVNDSLKNIYSELYQVPVSSIRNLPKVKNQPGEIPNRPISQDQKENILLYQGALNKGRGIELMITCMAFLPDYQLWIIGKGDIEAQLHQTAKEIDPTSQQIHFKGFISPTNLPALSCQAKLGLSIEEDLGLNYHYASPNKVYDYIQAGVPVLVSDLPEMRKTVEVHQVGHILPASHRTAKALADRIKEILDDPLHYQSLQENCHKAARILNWENEKGKLLELYKLNP